MNAPRRLEAVPAAGLPEPPYPADTRARGWKFELDLERIVDSDTWALAAPELRPWLLMLWAMSWRSTPTGTLPDDDRLIAARIGMPISMLQTHRETLMRGWIRHSDGRLYHDTISETVVEMLAAKYRDALRKRVGRQGTGVEIIARDGGECVYCGSRRALTIDHLIPLSKGGDNGMDNLACACKSCNSMKRDRTPEASGMTFRRDGVAERYRAALARLIEIPGQSAGRPEMSGGQLRNPLPEPVPVPEPKGLTPLPPNGGNVVGAPAPDDLGPPASKAPKAPPVPHDAIVAAYHELLPTCPRVQEWNEKRQASLRARWRAKFAEKRFADQASGIAYFRRYFAYVGKSAFLTGQAPPAKDRKPFVASLEWLILPSNFANVIEGKYHDAGR